MAKVDVFVTSVRKHSIEIDISRLLVGVPADRADDVVIVLRCGNDRQGRSIKLNYGEVDELLASAERGY